jgi:ATP-binding protein involved in chromosome partitioning
MEIRETSDSGRPVVVSDPDGPHARIYKDIAAKVRDALEQRRAAPHKAPPRIVVES